MITPVQSSPTPMQHAGADDACTRIHLYQQQLRAELLAAAANEATRPSTWRQWLAQPSVQPRLAITLAHGFESQVRALIGASTSYAHHQVAALGLAHAEA